MEENSSKSWIDIEKGQDPLGNQIKYVLSFQNLFNTRKMVLS